MKSLENIQKLSKIGKEFCRVIYVCCVVGFVGCIVGIFAMIIGAEAVKSTGESLTKILQTEADVNVGTIWTAIAVGMIFCAAEFVIARMAYRYFDNEIKAGTPFTVEGSKELLHLGISTIWIPLASIMVAEIAEGIIGEITKNAEKLDIVGFESVAIGIAFILVSMFCKCGAELIENKDRE